MTTVAASAPALGLVAALGLGGCSLAFPLDDYDRGSGDSTGQTGGPTTTGASATGTTATTGPGSGGAPPCGSGVYEPAIVLQDSFEEGAPQSFVGCGVQVGGQLRFDLPAGAPLHCPSESLLPYCLESSSITMKVPEAASAPIPGMQTWIILRAADDSGELRLLLEANTFSIVGEAGGTPIDIDFVNDSYDPFTNLWWRLAGENGEIVFSTSFDGVTWMERGRGDPLLSLDGVFIRIEGNRYINPMFPDSQNLPADAVVIDCFNLPGQCP